MYATLTALIITADDIAEPIVHTHTTAAGARRSLRNIGRDLHIDRVGYAPGVFDTEHPDEDAARAMVDRLYGVGFRAEIRELTVTLD